VTWTFLPFKSIASTSSADLGGLLTLTSGALVGARRGSRRFGRFQPAWPALAWELGPAPAWEPGPALHRRRTAERSVAAITNILTKTNNLRNSFCLLQELCLDGRKFCRQEKQILFIHLLSIHI